MAVQYNPQAESTSPPSGFKAAAAHISSKRLQDFRLQEQEATSTTRWAEKRKSLPTAAQNQRTNRLNIMKTNPSYSKAYQLKNGGYTKHMQVSNSNYAQVKNLMNQHYQSEQKKQRTVSKASITI